MSSDPIQSNIQKEQSKELHIQTNPLFQPKSTHKDNPTQNNDIKQYPPNNTLHSPIDNNNTHTENSVKQKDFSFSFKQPKDHSSVSDFKLSSSSNPQSYPNSNTPKLHNESNNCFEGDHGIKKPEPIQIGNINMNVNNYYSYFVDPTPEGIRKRILEAKEKKKYTCSCKKSQCLKLYCDCFANEEFCVDCNCQGCSNIIGNEANITKAFNEVKDKNPIAMKFNINEETVTLGCNCTKSNCLKKYCECFKAKLFCTDSCRCRDCDNCSVDVNQSRKMNSNSNNNGNTTVRGQQQSLGKNSYDKYSFEKISVMIEKKNIFVNRQENIGSDQFLNKKTKEQVVIRIKNHQTFIEIPKSMIQISNEEYEVLLNKKRPKDKDMDKDEDA